MLILSRHPCWHWKPQYGQRRQGPFAYRWLVIGTFQFALVNRRLKQELQQQIQAAIYRR